MNGDIRVSSIKRMANEATVTISCARLSIPLIDACGLNLGPTNARIPHVPAGRPSGEAVGKAMDQAI